MPGGEALPGARPHDDAVTAVAFAGNLLASGSRDQTVRLWLCADDAVEELLTLREPGPVEAVSFSADGKRLAVLVHGERAVRVWRLDWLRQSLGEWGWIGRLKLPEGMPRGVPYFESGAQTLSASRGA